MNSYARGSFKINIIYLDREFELLRELLVEGPNLVDINTTGVDDYVPEIERRIKVIKERVWAIQSTLLFKRLLKAMVVKLVFHSVL